jgi:ion channel-forming bestrophin family protein
MSVRHDWFRSFAVRGSVLPRIYLRIVVFTAASAAVTYILDRGWLTDLPFPALAIAASAVGLHIAFRTNSGYERFWEARTAWGAIVNRTRNIARQVHALLELPERRDAILLTIAFVHGAKRHFWHDAHTPEIDRLLGEERSRQLHLAPGPPQRTLVELSHLLRRARNAGQIDTVDQLRVEEDLTALIDQFGICQRIRSTPLPAAYVIQLRTALSLLLLIVPFTIVKHLGWWTPPTVFVLSYIFVGMEQIGTELEDPFERTANDIDTEGISQTIESDLLALCEEDTPFAARSPAPAAR